MTTTPKLTIELGPTPAETIIRLDGVPVGGIESFSFSAYVGHAAPYYSMRITDIGTNSKQIEALRKIPNVRIDINKPFAKTIPSNIADTEQEEAE